MRFGNYKQALNYSMVHKDIKIGDKYYNYQKIKHHVVNIFSDDGEEIITYKFWSKRKKQWCYKSDYKVLFLIQFKYGAEWI